MRTITAWVLVIVAAAGCASVSAEVLHFRARLSGGAETPPNPSRGSGVADLTLDTDSKLLSWRVTYEGLSGSVTAAHFRTPPEPGSALESTMDFKGPFTSPIVSSARLNDIEIGDLRAGLWSVNIMTARSPHGEIGGDLESQP